MYKSIIQLVLNMAGNEKYYFDTAIRLGQLTAIWGVSVSPSNEVWVMDEMEAWYRINPEKDMTVIALLFQRVRYLANQPETITLKEAI